MIEISLGTATRRLPTFRHVAHVTFTLSLSVGGCAVKLSITGKVLLIAFTGLRPETRDLLVHYILSMVSTRLTRHCTSLGPNAYTCQDIAVPHIQVVAPHDPKHRWNTRVHRKKHQEQTSPLAKVGNCLGHSSLHCTVFEWAQIQSYKFMKQPLIYSTGQKFGHTFSFNVFLYFHDYLHCRFSLKASKLWMNTYGIMYLTKKCEITENMSYILDSSK